MNFNPSTESQGIAALFGTGIWIGGAAAAITTPGAAFAVGWILVTAVFVVPVIAGNGGLGETDE